MNELTVRADVENIDEVIGFIDEGLEGTSCPMATQMAIDVAVDELFTNIASYSYGETGGEATVQFDLGEENGREKAEITFIDRGMPFDPTQHEDPDTSLSAEEREIGGLGILIVKRTMDSMSYTRDGDKNILTITKVF